MVNTEAPELSSEREAEWFEQQQKVEQLPTLLPEKLEPAFEHANGVCSCIDEGTNGDIRLAGSGILHPGGIEAVAKILRQQDVQEVTSHDNCGAAGIAYRRERGLPADADVAQADIDAFAADWSKRLADRLGARYRNIAASDMTRPPDFHNAAVVYIDSVGSFRPDRVPTLPQGFVITANLMDQQNILSESSLAANVALGDHGYGDRFTADAPLRIVMVGEATPDLQRAMDEFVDGQAGRVQVERLVVPEVEAV